MFWPCSASWLSPLPPLLRRVRRGACVVAGAAALMFVGCGDVESVFSPIGAFFRFKPVTAAPKTLLPALGNPGEWCTVTVRGNYYEFRSVHGRTDTYPITALEQYGSHVWISGLVVGTPSVPDINSGAFVPVCYDLVCPNCYEGGISRGVVISDAALGRVTCTRCHRVYDLEKSGIVVDGAISPADHKLFRYRCSYNNDAFVVQN